ncbi:MAG: TonB-dependent receptor, partial [candidate division WOR-3 bacterium]
MRKRAQLFFFLLISALLAFHPSSLQAQTTAGAIRGVVTDEANAVLPGATVTVTNISTGISRSVTTDEAGRYAFLGLPAAPYTLKAELQGFTPTVRQRIELAVGQTVEINFTLKVAGIQEEVMVTAEAPVINRETPELGGRMNPKSLLDLPINGRDYARFALLVPGAIARSNYIADLTFNGLHTVHNTFTIDGIDASRVDQPYMANGYERGARLLTGSLDSIQEFRVNTGIYQAEFGRASGSVINIVSKSGGNEVHGTLFEFLRNSVFDAKNFFLKPDQPKPLYILNQFGGNVSGPIVKNKTFYFMNYEGSRQRIGITGTGTVPSQALRQRVLATSPALAPLLATIPLGTSPTSNPDVDSYTTVKTSAVREDTGSIKVDHRFSDKDLFFARYNLNDTRVFGALFGVFPTALAKDQFQDVPVRTTNIALQEQHIFSSRMINEFKAGMQRWASQIISNTPFPLTTITGLTIQPGTRGRSLLNGTSFQWIDNFSVTHGEHSFKAGVEIRRVHINNRTMNTSTMIYASIEDFVKNSVSSASLTPGNPGRGTRGTQYGAYFQDDIRPASNVTLNLGIRYEYYSVLHEVLNRTTPYNLLRGDLDPPGSPYYHPDRNNFAPRFGFSWSPWGSAKTVLRGGVGIYFQAYPTGFGAYRVPLNNIPGATTLLRSQIPNLSFPLEPFIASGTTPLPNVAGFDPFRRDIYT